MNDPVVTTIIAKTLLCVILAVGAVLCVVYGYRMFKSSRESTRLADDPERFRSQGDGAGSW
jgi:hypothetical protein